MPKSAWILLGIAIIMGVVLGGALLLPTPNLSVKRVTKADEGLRKAIERARQSLKDFDTRLQERQPGERFAVRAKFPTQTVPEYLWVVVSRKEDGSYQGLVDQKPMAATVTKGEPTTVKVADVYDWIIYSEDGTREGGFTEEYLMRSEKENR